MVLDGVRNATAKLESVEPMHMDETKQRNK